MAGERRWPFAAGFGVCKGVLRRRGTLAEPPGEKEKLEAGVKVPGAKAAGAKVASGVGSLSCGTPKKSKVKVGVAGALPSPPAGLFVTEGRDLDRRTVVLTLPPDPGLNTKSLSLGMKLSK